MERMERRAGLPLAETVRLARVLGLRSFRSQSFRERETALLAIGK
jgi:hypothetical protein